MKISLQQARFTTDYALFYITFVPPVFWERPRPFSSFRGDVAIPKSQVVGAVVVEGATQPWIAEETLNECLTTSLNSTTCSHDANLRKLEADLWNAGEKSTKVKSYSFLSFHVSEYVKRENTLLVIPLARLLLFKLDLTFHF